VYDVYELVSLDSRREGKIQRGFVGGNELMTGEWMEVACLDNIQRGSRQRPWAG